MNTVSLDVSKLDTDDLEAHIDARYEAGAPQDELDALEVEYAKRVSEDEINMTEDELNVSEAWELGVDLEEWLSREFFEYTHPKERMGGREDKDFFQPRAFNDFLTLNLKPGIRRKDIMAAAKDVYEYRKNLIQRYKSKKKWPYRNSHVVMGKEVYLLK